MEFEVKENEESKVKFEAVVENDKFKEAVTNAFKKERKEFNIPGFRKGKAPRKIIEKQYGEEIFYEEAVNSLLPDVYTKAIDELDIEPIDRPDLDIIEIGKDKDLVIEFEVEVKPEAKLGKYKGLKLEKTDTKITEDDVLEELEKKREQNARLVNVEDRAIEEGDKVTINFAGTVDGEEFEGGSAEGHELEIGSGSFIPGFEEQLIGKNVGDEIEVEVTFPKDYQKEDLANKDAVFKVEIIGNKVKQLPDLDDEFAVDTSEFDTLEEYKEDIKEKLQKSADENAERALRDKVIEKACENMEVEIPEKMVEAEIDGMMKNFERQLSQQGIDMDTYAKMTGGDLDELKDNMRPDAVKRVETGLLFDALKKVEDIEATEEEINEEYQKFADAQDKEIEEIKEMLGGNDDHIKDSIVSRKTVDFLLENAEIE